MINVINIMLKWNAINYIYGAICTLGIMKILKRLMIGR